VSGAAWSCVLQSLNGPSPVRRGSASGLAGCPILDEVKGGFLLHSPDFGVGRILGRRWQEFQQKFRIALAASDS
jgi:hypothetical protein